jgi:LPXTG-site transpeptidase (sortase) family protein
MSHTVTPPEPVAWDSRQSAANFTSFEPLQNLFRLRLLSKALFWFFAPYTTAVLGWPLHFPVAFLPVCKNTKTCSVSSKFGLANRRAGYSHSYKLSQISLFILLNLSFISATPQATPVAGAASTIPTRLIIPGINLDSAVVPVGWKKIEVNGQIYGQWEVDKNLVGWHNLSATLGQTGNTVFNGHSNLYAQVFIDLGKVAIGDRILAFAGNQVYVYIVVNRFLVQEKGVPVEKRIENAKLILPTTDERLTLITCAQPGATHRLIVIAYPEYSYRD